jgi:hypothetical protein
MIVKDTSRKAQMTAKKRNSKLVNKSVKGNNLQGVAE